jgi:cold-inducible RNA-binding protein
VPYRPVRSGFFVICFFENLNVKPGFFPDFEAAPPPADPRRGVPLSKRLYVGNLSFNTSQRDLETLFAPYGATGVSVATESDGRSRGFGFVDVDEAQMQSAISATNGKDLGGRALNVNEARPRAERSERRENRW